MNPKDGFILPEAASSVAREVDRLYLFIQWVSVFFFLLVVGLMTLFVIKYRRRSESDVTPNIVKNVPLEIAWTLIPLAILIVIFFWGFRTYMDTRVSPHDALQVYVTAKKWLWQFDYPSYGVQSTELVVPQGRPVKLTMSSEDVIHSFYAPNFRIKQDVLPNRYTTLWFPAETLGEWRVTCAEYCGMGHSEMMTLIKVIPPEDFKAWLEAGGIDPKSGSLPLPELGKMLYKSQQCVTCHSIDGTRKPGGGPSFKGLFGRTESFTDGASLTVDEQYIRESIMTPNRRIVAGYQPVMPTYPNLKERQINALIEYIKTVE